MIMRWLLLISTSLIASQALSSELEVRMDCTVTHQTVVRSNDGKPEIYSSYEGAFKTGDSLIFLYRQSDDQTIDAELYDFNRDYQIVINGSSRVFKNENSLRGSTNNTLIYVSEDNIVVDTWDKSTLKLSRYYKNDFHGIYIGQQLGLNNIESQIATFDCRMIKDDFDEILKSFD